eukprot:2531186-Rhodomonas_salina.1
MLPTPPRPGRRRTEGHQQALSGSFQAPVPASPLPSPASSRASTPGRLPSAPPPHGCSGPLPPSPARQPPSPSSLASSSSPPPARLTAV